MLRISHRRQISRMRPTLVWFCMVMSFCSLAAAITVHIYSSAGGTWFIFSSLAFTVLAAVILTNARVNPKDLAGNLPNSKTGRLVQGAVKMVTESDTDSTA